MDEIYENEVKEQEAVSEPAALAKSFESEEELSNPSETDYAFAWSENQGNYSETVAKKTLNFIRNQGLVINTVLDICCGSGNFLFEMHRNGKKCTGTEILDSYIEYNKQTYKDIDFVKTKDMLDIDELGKFDLISANHDVINFLPTLEDWNAMFKKVYSHLNDGGVFIFDYYTKRKLQNWNEVTYSEGEKLDYVRHVVSDGKTQTKISNIYYIDINPKENTISTASVADREYSLNDYSRRFKRSESTDTEYYFENSEIVDAIKRAGYRYLILTDANLSPVATIADMNRVHVIAIKRES